MDDKCNARHGPHCCNGKVNNYSGQVAILGVTIVTMFYSTMEMYVFLLTQDSIKHFNVLILHTYTSITFTYFHSVSTCLTSNHTGTFLIHSLVCTCHSLSDKCKVIFLLLLFLWKKMGDPISLESLVQIMETCYCRYGR